MGKTWSGVDRKRFGKQKTKRHKSRAKWSSKNGGRGTAPRLRSLITDVAEFKMSGGEVKVPAVLQRKSEPPMPLPQRRVQMKVQMRLRKNTPPLYKELNGIGAERKALYDALTVTELRARLVFYTKQCQYFTATARSAHDSGDSVLAEEIRTKKYDFFIPEMNSIRLYLERFR